MKRAGSCNFRTTRRVTSFNSLIPRIQTAGDEQAKAPREVAVKMRAMK